MDEATSHSTAMKRGIAGELRAIPFVVGCNGMIDRPAVGPFTLVIDIGSRTKIIVRGDISGE